MVYIKYPWEPATKGQITHAKQLGITVPPNVTKGQISALIDEVKLARKPTSDQLTFAAALDITIPDQATFNELSALISEEVAIRSIKALAANLDLRAGKVIMYKGLPYEITFAGRRWKRYA